MNGVEALGYPQNRYDIDAYPMTQRRLQARRAGVLRYYFLICCVEVVDVSFAEMESNLKQSPE